MVTGHKQGCWTLCRSRCGTVSTVQDDQQIAVRADPSQPRDTETIARRARFCLGGPKPMRDAFITGLTARGESLGIVMPSGCRVGQCQSCAVQLLSGQVHPVLGREPENDATCRTCQAAPLQDIVLDA